MNRVILMGRLVKDPTITTAQSGTQIARYTLAVERRFKKDGDQTADFIGCVAFGKSAEFAEKYLHKGTKIALEGRIQTGSYEKDGQRIYTTDIVVENQEFAESKNASLENPATVATTATNPDPMTDSEGFMDIPDGLDSELPFH